MNNNFITGSPTQPERSEGCGGWRNALNGRFEETSGGQGRFNPAKRESVRPLSRTRVQFWLAVAVVLFTFAIATAGFIIFPTGEIHTSILTLIGEFLSFAAALFGFTSKFHHHETD